MQSKTNPRRVSVKKAPGVYRSSSGRYEIAYRDSDGRLRFQVVPGSLEEAKAARAEIVAKLGRGETVRRDKRTFAEFADEVVSGLTKRPRTVEAHRYALRSHLLPRFGKRKLGEIDTTSVARMVADMQRAGYAGWTIAGALNTLSLVMRRAKRAGLVPANPVLDLEKGERPSLNTKGKRVLSEAEIERLLKAAGSFRALIATMLLTGVRLGEVLGLTWVDIDFEHGFVRVRYQLDRSRERVEVKTTAGRRDIVLVPQLAAVLREHRLASPFSLDRDFVFPAPDGRGRDHRSATRGIERAVERAKLGEGVSSHGFRHTYASMLIVGLGLDAVRVATQLGHTSPALTLSTYAHEFEQARHADSLRDSLGQGFGHLVDVNPMSTSGRNQPQPKAAESGSVRRIRG